MLYDKDDKLIPGSKEERPGAYLFELDIPKDEVVVGFRADLV